MLINIYKSDRDGPSHEFTLTAVENGGCVVHSFLYGEPGPRKVHHFDTLTEAEGHVFDIASTLLREEMPNVPVHLESVKASQPDTASASAEDNQPWSERYICESAAVIPNQGIYYGFTCQDPSGEPIRQIGQVRDFVVGGHYVRADIFAKSGRQGDCITPEEAETARGLPHLPPQEEAKPEGSSTADLSRDWSDVQPLYRCVALECQGDFLRWRFRLANKSQISIRQLHEYRIRDAYLIDAGMSSSDSQIIPVDYVVGSTYTRRELRQPTQV